MKRWISLGLAAALATAVMGTAAAAQPPQPMQQAHPTPAQPASAKEADGASVDSTIAALYDVISGPAGAARNWNRMRALFAPDAKLMVVTPNREGGGFALRTMTVEDYISRNMSAFNTNGFYEREIARTTDAFGQLVHVFSTYELLRSPNDSKPFMRGINSIQLAHDGKRWWIANLVWRAEDAGLALPERYLQSHQ